MNTLEQYVLYTTASPGDIEVQVPDGKGGWTTEYSGTKALAKPGQHSGYTPPNNSNNMKPANADTRFGFTRGRAAFRKFKTNNPIATRNIKFGLGAAAVGAGAYALNRLTSREKTAGELLLNYVITNKGCEING